MRDIRTIAEANAALRPYVPLVGQLTGKDTTLERIRPLMALAGNPQATTRVVHIAGTSGKTSTAYYVAALLQTAGLRVGLTVSPHVDSVTERVQLDGQPISDERFCAYLSEFLDIVDKAPQQPSYFELLYAFSFWVFARENVDYAVIETGMGGLYDATNVADRPDKLCLITDIGFDHMHVLGHTIEAIAAQKAGIIHQGNPVLMYTQSDAVNRVVANWAEEQGAQLDFIDETGEAAAYGGDFVPELPSYQRRNWLLAYAAYDFLRKRDGLEAPSIEALRTTQTIQVPGRMDVRHIGDKTVVMDGAHNGQKMRTFLESFRRLYPDARPAVLIAMKAGKEPKDVGPLLAPIAARTIITTFDTSQDLPAKSIPPEELKRQFLADGVADVRTVPDHHLAYQELLNGPEPVCIITGSFYLLSQLREIEELI